MIRTPFNWFNKFGTLPATYKEAMSYEEQIMWLSKEVQRNESYAEEFQAEIDTINEAIDKINLDLDDVYVHLNEIALNKEDRLVQGTGLLLHRIEPIEGTPTVRISTSPIDVSELLIAGAYIPLSNKEIGDVIDLDPVTSPNTAYFMKYVEAGEIFEIVGKCDIAKINENNEITLIDKNNEGTSFDEPVTFTTLISGTLIISFSDTDSNVPEIREFITSDYIFDEINKKQTRLIAGTGISINGDVISATGTTDTFVNISSLIKSGSYIDLTNKSVGDTVNLTPIPATNTAYFLKEVALGEQFKITGNIIVAEIDNENKIVNIESGSGTTQNPAIYTCIAQLPSRARIIITFENTNANTPTIYDNIDQYYLYNNIEGSKMIRKLKADLYLDNSSPDCGLSEGLYYANGYHVYVNNVIENDFNEALFYVKENILYIICSSGSFHKGNIHQMYFYDTSLNQWRFSYMYAITDWSQVNNRPAINDISQNIALVDGTGTTGLSNGLYYFGNYHLSINGVQDDRFNRALVLADGNDCLYVIASPFNNHNTLAFYEVYYNSSTNTWGSGFEPITTNWSLIQNKPAIATSITSNSTNDEIAGAKAVFDFAGVKDTGWIDMSNYVNTTYFSARTEQPPMARRVNNQVYWTGEVYCTTSPNTTSADVLTGFPTWLKGNGEPQYANSGVTFNDGRPYNIFIVYSTSLSTTRIQVNEKNNIAIQNQYNGFQLSNLWGYFTDTPFPTNI